MPMPAGTGHRRDFMLRSAGRAGRVRRELARVAGLRGRHPRGGLCGARAARARQRLPRRRRRLARCSPRGRPPALRPRLALPDSGLVFTEDPRLRWHPEAAALRTRTSRASSPSSPPSAAPDQSHFTSRHYWEVGATNPGLRTGWIGRYLDRAGRPDNPLKGSASTVSSHRHSRPGRRRSRRCAARTATASGLRCLGRGGARDARDARAARTGAAPGKALASTPARPLRQTGSASSRRSTAGS